MDPVRVYAVVLRIFYLIRGSFARLVPLFAWVAIDMVLWGFITRYFGRLAPPGFDLVPALLGAVLLWDFLTRVMQGVTTSFFEDVWSRNFLNLFGSPLTISDYLGGLVVSSTLTGLIGLTVMLVLASAFFGLSFLAYGLLIVPFLLVLFVTGIALGIFASALVLRLGPAAEWFIWPLPALLSPFAAVYYPLATLPGWMQAVGRALPPAYVFENLRALVAGGAPSLPDLACGATLSAAYLLLACFFYARVHRYAVRSGLFARYSAESVS